MYVLPGSYTHMYVCPTQKEIYVLGSGSWAGLNSTIATTTVTTNNGIVKEAVAVEKLVVAVVIKVED